MIRHTIVFKLNSNATAETINHAINSMCALQTTLSGIERVIAGECYFHDDKSVNFFSEGMSHCIMIDFIDRHALDNFFKNPMTHSAKDAVIHIAEGGYAGIVGFDFIGTNNPNMGQGST